MRHFLPKRSSSAAASSRPSTVPTQQPAKPVLPAAQLASKPEPCRRSRSARRYPFPKRQRPWPKIVRPRRHPDLRDRKRRGSSLATAGLPPKQPLLCLQAPRSVLGAKGNVFVVNTVVNTRPVRIAPTQPTTVIAGK